MRFEVWAPEADTVVLEAAEVRCPMERDPLREGWWSAEAEAVDGDRYGFRVDDGPLLPDPRSRRQPDGPDGPSAVVWTTGRCCRTPVRGASRTGRTGRARWSTRGRTPGATGGRGGG